MSMTNSSSSSSSSSASNPRAEFLCMDKAMAMVVKEEEYSDSGHTQSPAPALTRTPSPSSLSGDDDDNNDDDVVWYDAHSDDSSSPSQTQPNSNGQKQEHEVEGGSGIAAPTTTNIRPKKAYRRVSFHCDSDNELSRQSSEVEVEAPCLSSSSPPLPTSIPPMKDVHFDKQIEHKPEEGVVLSLSPLSAAAANFLRDENNPTEDRGEEEDVAHEQYIGNEANSGSEHSLISSFYDSSHSLRCSLSLRSINEEDDKGDDTDDDVPVAVDMVEEPTNINPNTNTAASAEHGGDLQVQVQYPITPPLVDQDAGAGTVSTTKTKSSSKFASSFLGIRLKSSRRQAEDDALNRTWHSSSEVKSILRDSSFHSIPSPPQPKPEAKEQAESQSDAGSTNTNSSSAENGSDLLLLRRSIQRDSGAPCTDQVADAGTASTTKSSSKFASSFLAMRRKSTSHRAENDDLTRSWHPSSAVKSILCESSSAVASPPVELPPCDGDGGLTKEPSISTERENSIESVKSSSRPGSLLSLRRRRLSSSRRLDPLSQSLHSIRPLDPLSQSLHSISYLSRQKPLAKEDQSESLPKPKRKTRPSLEHQVSLLLGRSSASTSGHDVANNGLDGPGEIDYIIEDEKKNRSRFNLHWWYVIFLFCGISLFICLLQLFLPPPFGVWMSSEEVKEIGISPGCENGLEHCICPRETICAPNTLSIVFLTISRSSVYFDYPLYMMMFLSKAHNLNDICRRTILREWIDFGDMHKLHKTFGIVIGIETMSHSFFHMMRWGLNGDVSLLWRTSTGITGLVAVVVIPFIVLPMVVPFLKKKVRYEVRKGLHYLSIIWAVALLFHAPTKIPFLIGIPALVYAVDYVLGYFWRNNLIENVFFERYGENGVALHFKNPLGWEEKPKTSYVYIMCPWISKYQWHAFTMFPEPQKENHTMLCVGKSGNWTKELHDRIKAPCYRQIYVIGPFKSQFADTAVTTSNAIAVASGIGITPTLSLVLNYAGKKRINVVWMCRDPGLVEYILHKVDIGAITRNSFAFVFYTGTRELALPKHLPINIFIFKSRPDLENTVSGIVTAIHSGEGLPEEMYQNQKKIAEVPFRKRMMIAMSRVTQVYDADAMFGYAVKATERAAKKMKEAGDLESGISNDECPEDQVSLVGLDAMISKFLGVIGEYSRNDIEDVFHIIDRDATGYINRSDFDAFLRMVTSSCEKSSELVSCMDAALASSSFPEHKSASGLSRQNLVFGDSTTKEYMSKLMNDNDDSGRRPLEDWSIFYCGGSGAIHKNFRDISKQYSIDLAVEKFDW